jgi:DNA-binding PadR family transcriptional regulator
MQVHFEPPTLYQMLLYLEKHGLIEETMDKNKLRIPEDLQRWIHARKRFRLSDAQVQMARELSMNPQKPGSLANHKQEPWKAPLPVFIEHLYRKLNTSIESQKT